MAACVVCGRSLGDSPLQKYCSKSCQVKAYRQRKNGKTSENIQREAPEDPIPAAKSHWNDLTRSFLVKIAAREHPDWPFVMGCPRCGLIIIPAHDLRPEEDAVYAKGFCPICLKDMEPLDIRNEEVYQQSRATATTSHLELLRKSILRPDGRTSR